MNVAGVDYEGSFTGRGREDLLDIVRVNVEATVDVTREILTRRNRTQRFMLINACSLAAATPMPFKATYAASKRFVLDFSLALREELGDDASVTALCPAGLPTTRASVRGIFSQGLIGRVTAVSAGQAAVAALDAAEANRASACRVCSAVVSTHSRRGTDTAGGRAVGRRWPLARNDVFRLAEEALDGPALEDFPEVAAMQRGRAVVITGATSGIGLATRAARRGARGMRSSWSAATRSATAPRLETLRSETRAHVRAFTADLASQQTVQRWRRNWAAHWSTTISRSGPWCIRPASTPAVAS